MRKEKIIIGLIIVNIILVTIVCKFVINNTKILETKQKMKEMSEETKVTELNNQINAFNLEHTEYMNYIQTCKTKIATALINEGVETSDQETLETMADKISRVLQARTKDATATADNITAGKTAYINGELITGTGVDNENYYNEGKNSISSNFSCFDLGTGTTFNLSSYDNYQAFTANNFITSITNASRQCGSVGTDSPIASFSVNKSYDSTTGILKITAKIGCYSNVTTLSLSDVHTYLIY